MNFVFEAPRGQFTAVMERNRQIIAEAGTAAIRDVAAKVKREGRAEIGRAGFSRRFQNALRVRVFPPEGVSIDAAVFVKHASDYAGIFETGGTITGSPFLWLPLPAAPLKIGRQRVTPKLYSQRIGPLHSIKRPGKPPLLAAYVVGSPGAGKRATIGQLRRGATARRRVLRGRGTGVSLVSLPLFVGIRAVSIRKRFGLTAIFDRARASLAPSFLRRLREFNGA